MILAFNLTYYQFSLVVFNVLLQVLAVAVTYGEPRCHPFLAEKTARTCHVRFVSGCCVFELITRGQCPHVRLFRMVGIQYTHFQAANAFYVNMLTFLIAQGLTSVGFLPGARLIWQVRRPGRSHIARRLHKLGYRPLGAVTSRVIGSGGGYPAGLSGPGPGVHTV